MNPGVPADLVRVGRARASEAARSSRFVVPSALVDPERAEHTTATLCWSKYVLAKAKNQPRCPLDMKQSYGRISSAIWAANFPTLVPPYFCTSHVAAGSMEFWCKFGGVAGGVKSELSQDAGDEDPEDIG